MRRLILSALVATALAIGSVGAVSATPAEQANCIGEAATSFDPGTLGPELRVAARQGGLGLQARMNSSALGCVLTRTPRESSATS
jgi:hypothetical protein